MNQLLVKGKIYCEDNSSIWFLGDGYRILILATAIINLIISTNFQH